VVVDVISEYAEQCGLDFVNTVLNTSSRALVDAALTTGVSIACANSD
jgi:hypothetical protein